MSRKCDHDWFDHYMMYNMMSNGGGKGSGEAFWLLIAGQRSCCTGGLMALSQPIGTMPLSKMQKAWHSHCQKEKVRKS